MERSDASISRESQDKQNEHRKYWQKLFSHNGKGADNPPDLGQMDTSINRIRNARSSEPAAGLDRAITTEKTAQDMKSLPTYKAAGPDGLRAEFFEPSKEVCAKIVTNVMNEISE